MNNNMKYSRHSNKARKIKEERTIKLPNKALSLIIGVVMGATSLGAVVGLTSCSNNNNSINNEKERTNDDFYSPSEVNELESEITKYFNSLDETTKAEFNNNPQYLIDFAKWINGLEITDFTEDYILNIYEMINNANDNVATAFYNNQEIKGQPIKASKFIKPTNQHIDIFTEREAWLEAIISNPNDIETAKKWMTSDIYRLDGLDASMTRFQDLTASESELALAVGTFDMMNFVDKVLSENGINSIELPTIDGESVSYPLFTTSYNGEAKKITEVSSDEDFERPYFSNITDLLTECDDYLYESGDDQNSYGTLLEVQLNYIKQNSTSKLEMINDAKSKASAMKELAIAYKDKNGEFVRINSKFNC